jgi:hypothetical protein
MSDNDLEDLKISVAEMRVEIRSVLDVMRAGDREAHAGTKLLAQTVEQLARTQEKSNAETEKLLGRYEMALNAQRRDLDAELTEHADHPSPHTLSVGHRLDRLERKLNEARGAIALVFAVPAIFAVVDILNRK